MIKELYRKVILVMTVEEYFDQLTAAGEGEEVVEAQAGGISEIHVGGTPPYLSSRWRDCKNENAYQQNLLCHEAGPVKLPGCGAFWIEVLLFS